MKRFLFIIKRIHLKDFLAPFIFLLLLVPSLVFRGINKIKGRKLWLVAEHGEARDNGYHFYKYVREKHSDDYCFYAIKVDDPGYEKVAKLGNVIKYGSLKHWLYYMSANLNISSQKSGNPSPVFFGFVHTMLKLYNNRVFLQHGITKDDADWLYYGRTRFKFFVCGAKKEYEYIKEKFNYPEGHIILTGFPRWDNLKYISRQNKVKSILVMPTWRNWLGGEKNAVFAIKNFKDTEYYKCWNGFLNNKKFIKYIEKNNIVVYFYPHMEMQKFLKTFSFKSNNIKAVTLSRDIQHFFNSCELMITDYSSVAFDFAYLGKPVIYYQFDEEEYRKKQLQKGYFDYRKDGFGPVCENSQELVDAIKSKFDKKYLVREKEFFGFCDNENCKRVYEAIK